MCYNGKSKGEEIMLLKEQLDDVYKAYQKTMEELHRPKSFFRYPFGEYQKMYIFLPDNLSDCIRKLDVKKRKVLSLTASGDYLLNLTLAGASKIDNFDINKNTYFITCLKVAALQTLSYEEFLLFFMDGEKKNYRNLANKYIRNEFQFDYKVYLRIRSFLPEEVALYWDYLYEEYQFNGLLLATSGLFYGSDRQSIVTNNLYLKSEKKYNMTSEKLKKVDFCFYFCDVLKIHTLPHRYDILLLSNVFDYLQEGWYLTISEDTFKSYAEKELPNILEENAIVVVDYQYHYKMKNRAYTISLSNLFQKGYTFSKQESSRLAFKKVVTSSKNKEYIEKEGNDLLYVFEGEKE